MSTAVDQSAVARVVGIKTIFQNLRGGVTLLPQRIAVIGQGSSASVYSTDKARVTSAAAVGSTYGFGSPLHLAVRQLLPANGDGVGTIPVTVYPLEDAGGAVTAAGDITPSGAVTSTQTLVVRVNNIDSQPFTVAIGDTVADIVAAAVAAINANINMPVIAVDNVSTSIDLTAKWAGETGNDIVVGVIGADTGITFAITQPVGGATNPDVQTALDQFGEVWETLVLNCLNTTDTTAIAAIATFNEGRWLPTVRRPFVSFVGTNEADVATAVVLPESRKTDRTNCQLVEPAGNDLPCVIAARQLARIAVVANNNPPQDYGSQKATGLVPGVDGSQWTYTERDIAVKGGSSTIQIKDGVVNLSDIVTFYHPTGEEPPAYRYVVDIVKLQNILFNLDLIFAVAEWDGAPLIPDDQPTTNRTAKKPKMARAEIAKMLDSLGLEAIISDPKTAKGTIIAEIDDANPKRLNVTLTAQLSGNANIISVDFNFGFFFGTPAVVA